ncbi:MAG: hypothetical protein ACKO04_04740 [Actinomycetes bacterium]
MTSGGPLEGAYSTVADEQLDELEATDPDLYNDVLTVCELIFGQPERAQAMSTAIRTDNGIRLRLSVPGRYPYKVFWSSDGPRVEAVFPHP